MNYLRKVNIGRDLMNLVRVASIAKEMRKLTINELGKALKKIFFFF